MCASSRAASPGLPALGPKLASERHEHQVRHLQVLRLARPREVATTADRIA